MAPVSWSVFGPRARFPLFIASGGILLLAACNPAPPEPRNIRALVGAGSGTISVNAFFPSRLRIHEGDTVTWVMNAAGDPHTVTFTGSPETVIDIVETPEVPEGRMFNLRLLQATRGIGDPVETFADGRYFNSGIFFGAVPSVPEISSYSLRFTAPGEYHYVCGIHEYMTGTVVVEDGHEVVPSQPEVDMAAQVEMAPLLELASYNRDISLLASPMDREPGPEGAGIWVVRTGIGPREAEVVGFAPKNLRIASGDTVLWVSTGFHAVVFEPTGRFVPFYVPRRSPPDLDLVAVNRQVIEASGPRGRYAGADFVSSGLIGPGARWFGTRENGVAFALTFSSPGTYTYTCPVHAAVGMTGSITVVEPSGTSAPAGPGPG